MRKKINHLFAGLGSVRIVKNCDRGLENAARGRRPRVPFSRPNLNISRKVTCHQSRHIARNITRQITLQRTRQIPRQITRHITRETIIIIILLPEKFLQFDWLRADVFQLNLKYLHVKMTVTMVTQNHQIITSHELRKNGGKISRF